MNGISRRQFTRWLGLGASILGASTRGVSTLGASTLLVPSSLLGQAKPKVVVIGGGAGGATVARYLARDAGGALEVTLIESSARYTSCFYSNLYVGGLRDFESITHDYATLAAMDGLSVVADRATGIDQNLKRVTLAQGGSIAYDRLVVSPGIDLIYDSVPGYSAAAAEKAPHAWQGGPQTALLKQKLDALENGQNIIMIAPPNPYRCPPGPYERVSMMAHILKSKGFTDSTITILDTKPGFSKQGLFDEGWQTHYNGMIEWLPPDIHGGITAVDADAGTVDTDFDTFEGALLNIIPAQRAAAIAVDAGLVDDSGYCPIDATSMRSTIAHDVFVLGDACIAGAMPKSAFSANSQARVAAAHIRADLLDTSLTTTAYANTCWSLIAPDDGVKVGARYEPGEEGAIVSVHSFISEAGETSDVRRNTYLESVAWYDAITRDMFGAA